MENKEECKGIYDRGFVYPEESKIINFLDKLYNIPYENSKTWEKLIFDFFKENPVVIYYIERSLDDHYDELKGEISNGLNKLSKSGFVCWDSEEAFKSLCKIRDSIKIDHKQINRYCEFFFKNSIILRKFLTKIIDNDDSLFKNFKSLVKPFSKILTYSDNPNKIFENSFILCADGNIDYNFNKIEEDISKRFDNKIRSNIKPNNVIKTNKRKPLDSRLRHECFKRDNYKCKECGATNVEKMLHADHILPVSQGGFDELSNLQTLCDDCNYAKFNKCYVGGKNGTKIEGDKDDATIT